MININLLPPEFRKHAQNQFLARVLKSLPMAQVVGVVVGVLAILLLINVCLQLMIFFRMGSVKAIELSLPGTGQQKTQVDTVLRELKALRQQISAIENITTGRRLFWAQKLNILSNAMPSGIWLVRVALTKDHFMIEGSAIARKGDYASSVSTLSAKLRNSMAFMKGIKDVDMNFVGRRKIHTTDLMDFVIRSSLAGK